MSISTVTYQSPAVFALSFPPPAVAFLVKTLEAADAGTMEKLVQQALDEVHALNAVISAAYPDSNGLLLTYSDADLAGGGDGHTFVFTMYFVPDEFNTVQALLGLADFALLPQNVGFKFGLGSTDDAVESQMTDVIVRLTAVTGDEVAVVWEGNRGSAKGTRFMCGAGGVVAGGGGNSIVRSSSIREKLKADRAARALVAAEK